MNVTVWSQGQLRQCYAFHSRLAAAEGARIHLPGPGGGGRQTTDHGTDSPVSNPTEGSSKPSPLEGQILDYEGDIGP